MVDRAYDVAMSAPADDEAARIDGTPLRRRQVEQDPIIGNPDGSEPRQSGECIVDAMWKRRYAVELVLVDAHDEGEGVAHG